MEAGKTPEKCENDQPPPTSAAQARIDSGHLRQPPPRRVGAGGAATATPMSAMRDSGRFAVIARISCTNAGDIAPGYGH